MREKIWAIFWRVVEIAFFGAVALFLYRAHNVLYDTGFYKENKLLSCCFLVFFVYGLYFLIMASREGRR